MNCFPCFSSHKNKNSPRKNDATHDDNDDDEHERRPQPAAAATTTTTTRQADEREITEQTSAKTFNFRELATATKYFRQECLLGEGAFGRVYKGTLQSSGQFVAVKQLDKHGMNGNKEFLAEVLSLAKLEHPNLVKFIGYCADGDQRLLVFEFVSGGPLQEYLYEQKAKLKPMDWITRMKIAYGAAQGLDYLHDKVNPPVIYRDLKTSNILVDDAFYPKLCDFGMHNLEPGTKDSLFASSRAMDTYGYSAPEYTRGEDLTVKSDVYSFGVVLLELITGRRAIDTTKPNDEQNLVTWALPIFKDPKRYPDMADPVMRNNFSERGLNQAVAITSMCLQEEPTARPLISDVMVALSFLSTSTEGVPAAVPVSSFRDKSLSIALSRHGSCSIPPLSLPRREDDDKSSGSSDSEEEEEEEETMSKEKQEEEANTDDESDSNSEKSQEEEEESFELEKQRKSSSSSDSGSEGRRPIDENNATAQSLKMNYSYSSEEEDNERRSSKGSSSKSNEESTSLRYNFHDDSSTNTSTRINSLAHDDDDDTDDDDEDENDKTDQLEHIHSSKSEVQNVYSDDDDDEDEESGQFSLRRTEPGEEEHSSSDQD